MIDMVAVTTPDEVFVWPLASVRMRVLAEFNIEISHSDTESVIVDADNLRFFQSREMSLELTNTCNELYDNQEKADKLSREPDNSKGEK